MDKLAETLEFRTATREDSELVNQFIWEMARYEKMEDCCKSTPESVAHHIFDGSCAEVEFAMLDGKEVGFILYYPNFSTFEARPGIHLEELFVREEYRGRGIGKALLHQLARKAKEQGCGRLEWWCLDWNKPSRDFYDSQGAVAQTEWLIYRLDKKALESF